MYYIVRIYIVRSDEELFKLKNEFSYRWNLTSECVVTSTSFSTKEIKVIIRGSYKSLEQFILNTNDEHPELEIKSIKRSE